MSIYEEAFILLFVFIALVYLGIHIMKRYCSVSPSIE